MNPQEPHADPEMSVGPTTIKPAPGRNGDLSTAGPPVSAASAPTAVSPSHDEHGHVREHREPHLHHGHVPLHQQAHRHRPNLIDDCEPSQRISTHYAGQTGRWLLVGGVAVLVLLGIGFLVGFFLRRDESAHVAQQTDAMATAVPGVDVVTVEQTPTTYPLTLPGQTAGWYQSTIHARVDGYVGKWMADIGDRVHAGQVLCTIETPDLDQQLNAAKAKVNAADAQVQVAQANESIAKTTYDRWWQSPKGVVSEQERQEKKSTYDSAAAQLIAAKAQAQLDQADVDRLEAMESFKQVVAPYDGVVTGRHIDLGDLVTANSTAPNSTLYDIAQTRLIRTFVDVPQKAAAAMTVGLNAEASSEDFPGRVFEGKVARSARSIDPQTRTQRTEVDIPNPDLVLVPGMYVQVTFHLKQHGLLVVPAAAILYRPGGLEVAIVNDQNKVEFRHVTVARDNGDTLEIATGLQPNERVALNLGSDIVPGEQVEPTDADTLLATPATPQPAPVPAPAMLSGGAAANATPSRYTPEPDSGMNPPAPAVPPPGGAAQAAPLDASQAGAAPQIPANASQRNQPAGGAGSESP